VTAVAAAPHIGEWTGAAADQAGHAMPAMAMWHAKSFV